MAKIKSSFLLLTLLLLTNGIQAKTVKFNYPNINYEDRILYHSDFALLSKVSPLIVSD